MFTNVRTIKPCRVLRNRLPRLPEIGLVYNKILGEVLAPPYVFDLEF
jgi:hypothetical protein